jgi:hypothetical protein
VRSQGASTCTAVLCSGKGHEAARLMPPPRHSRVHTQACLLLHTLHIRAGALQRAQLPGDLLRACAPPLSLSLCGTTHCVCQGCECGCLLPSNQRTDQAPHTATAQRHALLSAWGRASHIPILHPSLPAACAGLQRSAHCHWPLLCPSLASFSPPQPKPRARGWGFAPLLWARPRNAPGSASFHAVKARLASKEAKMVSAGPGARDSRLLLMAWSGDGETDLLPLPLWPPAARSLPSLIPVR